MMSVNSHKDLVSSCCVSAVYRHFSVVVCCGQSVRVLCLNLSDVEGVAVLMLL